MIRILLVCTGNVCRSPLAQILLARQLHELPVRVESAGTRAREGMRMTNEAIQMAHDEGSLTSAHVAHRLRTDDLAGVDLMIAMAREHRREVVELEPAMVRKSFTLLEFARLMAPIADEQLLVAAGKSGSDAGSRVISMLALVASQRGAAEVVVSPSDDDVVDPIGRSWEVYEHSTAQIVQALPAVRRLVRLAFTTSG